MKTTYTPTRTVDQPFSVPYPDFRSDLIPVKKFAEPFIKVLNKIHGILTWTERRLLALLGDYCYEDGWIYPKQITIADKLQIDVRHVRRLVKSLVQKKFMVVQSPDLVDRHLFGRRRNDEEKEGTCALR